MQCDWQTLMRRKLFRYISFEDFVNLTINNKDRFVKHEGEYRLLIADNSLYLAEDLSSFGVKFDIEKQVKGKNADEIIDYLTEKICLQRANWDRTDDDIRIEDAGNICEFLDSVMVHPLAPKWYVDIIRGESIMWHYIGS